MKKTLIEQMSPDYGYDENGLWRGMTREQVAEMLAEMRQKSERRMALFHWDHRSSPAN
jgi:hypothetical protein